MNIKQQTRELLTGRDLNGFSWCYCENGLHTFSKQIEDYNSPYYGKYITLRAEQEDLTNGNLEYFTKNGITR